MNLMKLMSLKKAWSRFKENHPKFPKFLSAVYRRGISERTRIEFKVVNPDGEEICAAVRLGADDVELFRELEELMR